MKNNALKKILFISLTLTVGIHQSNAEETPLSSNETKTGDSTRKENVTRHHFRSENELAEFYELSKKLASNIYDMMTLVSPTGPNSLHSGLEEKSKNATNTTSVEKLSKISDQDAEDYNKWIQGIVKSGKSEYSEEFKSSSTMGASQDSSISEETPQVEATFAVSGKDPSASNSGSRKGGVRISAGSQTVFGEAEEETIISSDQSEQPWSWIAEEKSLTEKESIYNKDEDEGAFTSNEVNPSSALWEKLITGKVPFNVFMMLLIVSCFLWLCGPCRNKNTGY